MKVSKSLLQTIALAVVVSTTLNACSSSKEEIKPTDEKTKIETSNTSNTQNTHYIDNCPACGMG